MRGKGFILIVVLMVLAILSACGGAKKETEPPKQPSPAPSPGAGTTTVDVQSIYKSNCMACHGANMEGGGSFPPLKDVGARLNRDQILTTVTNGRGAMPAFKGRLKDNELQALADWLAAKK